VKINLFGVVIEQDGICKGCNRNTRIICVPSPVLSNKYQENYAQTLTTESERKKKNNENYEKERF
jgi:predicted Fe-S protein YdhL (DUF1289 family)